MRIVHVTATFPPYAGGTGNVCYYHCRELARHGHQVTVITAGMDRALARESVDGFRIHRLRVLLRIGNMPVLPDLIRELRGFDMIHLHYPFILGAEMVSWAAALYDTPLFVSFHNDLIGEGARAKIFSLYQNISERLTIRRAARLCILSFDHFESSRLYGSLAGTKLKTVELPNGVDLHHFHPAADTNTIRNIYNIPEDAKLVLFVAALDRAHHFKGFSNLLKALQVLPSNVWLVVVGDGDLRATYEQQAHRLGIANRTVFVGSVQHAKTPPFFRCANVTVLPSSPPESFGLVLIESLACGTPVVATRIPGVRTIVDHGGDGLLVETNNPTGLAGAIQMILNNDNLAQEMGQRGRAKVEACYSWQRIGHSLDDMYHQVLEERKNISIGSSNTRSKKNHREANL